MKPVGKHPVNALEQPPLRRAKRLEAMPIEVTSAWKSGPRAKTMDTLHGRRRDTGWDRQHVPLANSHELARQVRKCTRLSGVPLAVRREGQVTIARAHATGSGWRNEKHCA